MPIEIRIMTSPRLYVGSAFLMTITKMLIHRHEVHEIQPPVNAVHFVRFVPRAEPPITGPASGTNRDLFGLGIPDAIDEAQDNAVRTAHISQNAVTVSLNNGRFCGSRKMRTASQHIRKAIRLFRDLCREYAIRFFLSIGRVYLN
jgi:hypothetical protein